ncbi:MAG TPA: glutamate--tRNA ligase [Eubacteriales bacterium]|nr:glutamate--tRNA ligase [Eubacteriales bacterium]HRU84074.1 glutamate--tRNA ligase [Eubacteriales bacterium]
MDTVRTRFAPSPTGFMHIGNLRTALYAFLFARANNGKFILRIEDTDRERFIEGAVDVIFSTLKKAGLTHDEGPDVGGDFGPYIQSERKEIYTKYAKKLVELGGAYYCFCSKERLEELADDKGVKKYDKHCLKLTKSEIEAKLAAGESYVIRQNIPEHGKTGYTDLVFGEIELDCADLEDNILLKSDGMPTYNFANVVDDHLMAITHVIRGSEYLSSTPKYNLIYDSFGWQRPAYIHLPVIMKDAARKLSKRYGDANFEDFIHKGYLAEAIVNYIALLGWSPKENREKFTLDELIARFSVDGLNNSPAIFDEAKLKWLNAQYVKELSPEDFLEVSKPYFAETAKKYAITKLAPLTQPRVEILSEIGALWAFLDSYDGVDAALYENKKQKADRATAKEALKALIPLLSGISEWTQQSLHDAVMAFAEASPLKKGQLLWPLRIAVTNRESTPGGAFEMLDILGKDESLRRLNSALAALAE